MRWQTMRPMPWPRVDFGLFALGRRLFLLGGQKRGGFVSDVDILDTRTGQWEAGPPLGEPRRGLAFARIGDVLYIFGGMDERYRFSNRVESYDLQARTVADRPPAPRPMAWAAAAALDGAVYLLGGFDAGSSGGKNQVWRYTPDGDRWEPLQPLPEGAGGWAVAWGGQIYLIGGAGRGTPERVEPTGHLHAYDPRADRWDALAPMPTPRSAVRALVAAGRILTVGGKAAGKSGVRSVEQYDIAAGRWEELNGLRQARGAAGVTLAPDGRVWVMGGECSQEGLFDAVEAAPWPAAAG